MRDKIKAGVKPTVPTTPTIASLLQPEVLEGVPSTQWTPVQRRTQLIKSDDETGLDWMDACDVEESFAPFLVLRGSSDEHRNYVTTSMEVVDMQEGSEVSTILDHDKVPGPALDLPLPRIPDLLDAALDLELPWTWTCPGPAPALPCDLAKFTRS